MSKRTKVTFSLILVICLLLSGLPSAVPVAATEADKPLTSPITESTATEPQTVTKQIAVTEEIPVLQLDADCQILNHVDPEVFAAGNHIARLPEQETLSSYVFLNADGSQTVYYMDQPVKFEKADGTVAEKNLTLTAATEGYTTTQNDIQLTIPTNPTNGIRLVYDNHYVTLIPQGGTLTNAVQATDSSVTYPDYYGEGMSLRYTPTLSGVKEDILLDTYSGVNSFTFRLNTGGLNLYQANGRYFLAESKVSTERIELGEVVSYDAKSRFSIGTMTAQTIMPGQAYMLTLTVDEAFLTDENTTYPVTIDPTLEVSDNTHGAGAIEDVTIYQGKPTTNANWSFLHCGYYDSTYGVARTLVRLTGLINDKTWQDMAPRQITSASFFIHEATGTNGPSVSLCANTGSSSWTESGVTWSNAGAVVGTAYSTKSPASNVYAAYDITNLLKAWKWGSANVESGFILKNSNETNTDKAFLSSEYSTTTKRPYVTVTYEEWSNGISNNTEYYIMNQSSKLYIALWNTSDLDNTSVLTRSFISDDIFRWRASLQSDGSHKLISVASPTGKTLRVSGTNIVLYSNNGYATANFTLTRINDDKNQDIDGDIDNNCNEGLHYIRYQDYYVAQDSSNHVILTTTPSDAAVWHITAVSPGRAVSFANNYPQDQSAIPIQFITNRHHTAFVSILGNYGYTTATFTNERAQTAYPYLLNTDIFVYSGHGNDSRLAFSTTYKQSLGYIGAHSNMDLGADSYYISNYDDGDFSSLRCVLYVGCSTAVSCSSHNLVDETYKKGARFVLGLCDEANFNDSNTWLETLLNRIADGDSIAAAINKANLAVGPRSYTYHDDYGNATAHSIDGLPIYCIGDGSQILEIE